MIVVDCSVTEATAATAVVIILTADDGDSLFVGATDVYYAVANADVNSGSDEGGLLLADEPTVVVN